MIKLTKDSLCLLWLRKLVGGVTDRDLAYEFSMSESQVNRTLNDLMLFVYENDQQLIERRNLSQLG